METNPQSNTYHQILLTEEQFKRMSDALAECFDKQVDEDLKDGFEVFNLEVSEESYALPDLQEIQIK